VRRYDQGLLWFNLVSLLTVSFMPFPTALIGARLETDAVFPVVFYAASMTLASIALTLTWLYAVRRGLVNPATPASEVRAFTGRAFATSAVFLLSVAAAFLGLPVAVLFWLVLLPLARALLARASLRRQPRTPQT
jgi:TMEM175 potassium channel family protein